MWNPDRLRSIGHFNDQIVYWIKMYEHEHKYGRGTLSIHSSMLADADWIVIVHFINRRLTSIAFYRLFGGNAAQNQPYFPLIEIERKKSAKYHIFILSSINIRHFHFHFENWNANR